MWDGLGIQLRGSWLAQGTPTTPLATPTRSSCSIPGLGFVAAVTSCSCSSSTVTAGSPSSSTVGLPIVMADREIIDFVSDDEQ
jgi:hypothetical protein